MNDAKRKVRAARGILLAAVLLFGCKGDGRPSYRTEPVTRGELEAAVTASGAVNAVTTVQVGTQVSGTIRDIFVDFNSRVKKGQLIARIDPSTFEAQVRQARANLLSAEANRGKSESALVDAKRTLDRNQELFSRNLIPRSDLDTAMTNFDTAKAQVSLSRAQVEQAKASLDFAEQNLAYTNIVSPVDGVVISRNVDAGQTVAASFATPTLFTIAEDLRKMQLNTNVAEADIGLVKTGQDVEFTVDAYPGRTFTGAVRQVRQAPITVQNVVTYDVVIQVENPDFKLMPGMTANVSIIVATRRDALMVPNAALRFRMPDRPAGEDTGKGAASAPGKRGQSVWVLEQGKPQRVSITPGISDGIHTEVVSGDLQEGQQTIVEAVRKNKGTSTAAPRMF
jgi:HlyD family secretion protein